MKLNKLVAKSFRCFLAVLLTAAVTLSAVQTASAAEQYQIYNYEMRYHFKVPAEYKDKTAEIGSTNVNIYFSDSVYMFVKCSDFYETLSEEETDAVSRKNFTIGNSALKDTYNDEAYMRTYFEQMLGTISNNKEITSVTKERLNGETFWVCGYTTYRTETAQSGAAAGTGILTDTSLTVDGSQPNTDSAQTDASGTDSAPTNPAANTTTHTFTGEGKIYFNLTKGIMYQITVYSLGAPLEDTPAALETAETFTVGRITSFGTVFIWIFIIAAAIALIALALMQLNVISFEEQEEVETLDLPIDAVNAYNDIGGEELKKKREALESGLITQEEYDEAAQETKIASFSEKESVREYSDDELEHKKRLAALRVVDTVLRVFDSDREEKSVILDKVDTLLGGIKAGKLKPEAASEEDESATKVLPNVSADISKEEETCTDSGDAAADITEQSEEKAESTDIDETSSEETSEEDAEEISEETAEDTLEQQEDSRNEETDGENE